VNDIVREFLLETHESLAQLDLDLVTLEKEPSERETLARVFRTLHTVKGTAGFLGLAKLQAVSHAAESLLSRLRNGTLTFTAEIATALLGAVDALRKMLSSVERTEQEGDGDYSALIATLERLTQSATAKSASPPAAPAGFVAVAPPAPPPAARPAPTPKPQAASAAPDSGEIRAPAVADTSIRVDVGLLDKLMTLVGELVLARNQIVQFTADSESAPLLGTVQRLNVLTTELQAGVMKTRMQPIGNVWAKFPRLVRDLAVACGKQVRLELEGQETELDRTVMEAVRDPLTHMVRNAIDHGIEPPAGRVAAGKPVTGELALRAAHEGGKVVIEIADDGGGIDPTRVRDKALATKLISPEAAARMSERELLNLVFLPGFSTADRVTHFSGRGVGMDVVRANVERIGGTVDIDSRVGRGTALKLRIPLTLAIIPALMVAAGGDRYAIPQASLTELLRVEPDRAAAAFESVRGAPVYRLRGNLLPLVNLSGELAVGPRPAADGSVSVVVLQADDRQFGLIVDEIHDTEEIVVKPLQKPLKAVGVYAGATILGDGKVALILDVPALAQRAGVVSGGRERARPDRPEEAASGERHQLLLFAAGGGRMALPLARVARLEEFDRAAIERVGKRRVVQYRGEILPLLPVGRALGSRGLRGRRRAAGDKVQVVVYAVGAGRVGLVVGRILDIVDEEVAARRPAARPGVLFDAVIQGRVTAVLDADALARTAGEG
jgi:two-component system chemotaxis sensor kinase CheA